MRTMCLCWGEVKNAWQGCHPEATTGIDVVEGGIRTGWWNTGSLSVTAEPVGGQVGGASGCELTAATTHSSYYARERGEGRDRGAMWTTGASLWWWSSWRDDAQTVISAINPRNTFSLSIFTALLSLKMFILSVASQRRAVAFFFNK